MNLVSLLSSLLWLSLAVGLHTAAVIKDETCDFEKSSSCSWQFTSSDAAFELEKKDLEQARKQPLSNATYSATIKNVLDSNNVQYLTKEADTFQVVVGMVSGRNTTSNHYAYYSSKKKTNNIPMIVSPYYQHSHPQCLLSFSYRVIGDSNSYMLVSTQLIALHAISTDEFSDLEAEDWTIPTERKKIFASPSMSEPIEVHVPIGEFSYPTRIRIECHVNSADTRKLNKNVECFVDDIRLENCQEHVWQPNVCSMEKEPRKYLCHRHGEQKCIDFSDICDMHSDCANFEDEDNKIHNCKLAPPSARCTFEETRHEAGCENWVIMNAPNSMELITLTAVADVTDPGKSGQLGLRQTIMPLDKTNNAAHSGHYLMFSTFADEQTANQKFINSGIQYSHVMTPLYPRMDPKLNEHSSKLHGTCLVRFFFCHIGATNFQIILERIKTSYKKVIWTPPRAPLVEPCVWERATIVLDYQPTEYFLKFGIAKLNNHKALFLVDDFSLSPNCFLMKAALLEATLPPTLTLTTCGLTGPVAPSAKQCENPVNDYVVDGQLPISGRRSFMIDKKTEYRIELYGAGGGQLSNQTGKNNGGLVVFNYMFEMADEVTFLVGQKGESPCTAKMQSKKQQQIADMECSPSGKVRSKLLLEDSINIIGTGGGGASAVFVNGQPLAIAAGGGGVYPQEVAAAARDRNSSDGGFSLYYIERQYEDRDTFLDLGRRELRRDRTHLEWTSGHGGGYDSPRVKNRGHLLVDCQDCLVMSGQLMSPSSSKAGICPSGRNWSIAGGYGGGGASCGPGAGGGAGYTGGLAGFKSDGEGGSSAVFWPVSRELSIFKGGINPDDGRIVIRACSLPCVVNATCRYEEPVDGQVPIEYCECLNGLRVSGSETCDSALRGFAATLRDTFGATHPKTLFALLLILLLLILIPCLVYILLRIYKTRRKQKAFKNFHNELQLIATDPLGMGNAGAIVTRGSISSNGQMNLITGNPIYQYVDLMDVPQITREWCEFHDVIGHGAFGEVRSGLMKVPGEPSFRVAVKTLPFESNPEVFHDFQTEARILCNFSHPNIVKFYGVCFDKHPKFIVLELLEGGDLKNYLRECRPKLSAVVLRGATGQGSASVPVSPTAVVTSPEGYQLMMNDLVQISLDVAQGCEYLECNKFVHRDIAARNCLLSSKNPLTRTVKIADFGMARDIYRNDYYRKGGRAFLPVKWMPPEAFLDGIFTTKTDTWAFGVLLWEIFSMGYTPYPGISNQEVMQLIVSGGRLDPPIGTPEEIYGFMIRCWETASDARPSFKQIVQFLTEALQLPHVKTNPLPQIVYKLNNNVASETSPMTTRSSAPPGDNDNNNPVSTASQGTINTMMTSMTESTTTSSYDSMPTAGTGVSHNICPPYEAKYSSRSIGDMGRLERIASGDSMSSHDDSTLHDTCSVKKSPYNIDKGSTGLNVQQQPATASGSAAAGGVSSLPFHKRLFRRSVERPKTGSSQPLISSASSSPSTTNGGQSTASSSSSSTKESGDHTPKRGQNESPPLPSQLL